MELSAPVDLFILPQLVPGESCGRQSVLQHHQQGQGSYTKPRYRRLWKLRRTFLDQLELEAANCCGDSSVADGLNAIPHMVQHFGAIFLHIAEPLVRMPSTVFLTPIASLRVHSHQRDATSNCLLDDTSSQNRPLCQISTVATRHHETSLGKKLLGTGKLGKHPTDDYPWLAQC